MRQSAMHCQTHSSSNQPKFIYAYVIKLAHLYTHVSVYVHACMCVCVCFKVHLVNIMTGRKICLIMFNGKVRVRFRLWPFKWLFMHHLWCKAKNKKKKQKITRNYKNEMWHNNNKSNCLFELLSFYHRSSGWLAR